jgi:ssDNA-binding Zn-finger/Zn-ribbon topoisomerase 1
MLGSKRKESSKEKMRNAWTPERKAEQAERTRLQNANRPVITCPHCGKQGTNTGNMNRYHFANCSIWRHCDLNLNPLQVHE